MSNRQPAAPSTPKKRQSQPKFDTKEKYLEYFLQRKKDATSGDRSKWEGLLNDCKNAPNVGAVESIIKDRNERENSRRSENRKKLTIKKEEESQERKAKKAMDELNKSINAPK